MNEYEKLLAGLNYDSRAKECTEVQNKGKKLIQKLNNISPDNVEEINNTLKELLGNLGENARIITPFYADFGRHIYLDDNVIINYGCSFLDTGKIEIGSFTMIGPDVKIYTANHPVSASERYYIDENNQTYWHTSAKPVKIGSRSWIGGGSIICPGVTIGSNVVIAAGSVVVKSIPDNVIAGGNPCKIIKENK